MQTITPFLWFDNQAEEAANFYVSVFKNSLLSRVKPYLNEKGINVPEAKVPPGTYNIEIAIADDQGRVGLTIQTWIVR